jgi:uncharacterized protein (TIGR02147 family)
MSDYVELLSQTLVSRRALNPRYSLRAYSRDLGMSPSRLSRILRGQRGLSEAWAQKLAHRLGLAERERKVFLLSALSQHSRARSKRLEAQALIREEQVEILPFRELTEEEFSPLASLEAFALIECFHLRKLPKSTRGFAKAIGIPESRAQALLDRLERMRIVRRRGQGYILDPIRLTTLDNIPSKSIRKFNQEVLACAAAAIEHQSIDERDFSTLTIAVSKKLLPELKSKIASFRRELNRFVERSYVDSTSNPDQVCTLAIQLFRVTKESSS